jgi:hypothetical protein
MIKNFGTQTKQAAMNLFSLFHCASYLTQSIIVPINAQYTVFFDR